MGVSFLDDDRSIGRSLLFLGDDERKRKFLPLY